MKNAKKVLLGLFVVLFTFTATACGNTGSSEPQTLIISTWGLEEDTLWDEVYKPFEEEYNVTIQLETGTTSDRYTKLASNPNSTIDIIELSQKAAADGYEAGLFAAVDYSKVSNYKNLIPAAQAVADQGYGPAYTINSIGIIYDKEAVGFEIKDWSDLWDARLEGKISIPDIATTFGPAMVHVASDYKGVDIATDNGDAAFKALEELKPNIVKTYSKSADAANMFASGEIAVAVVGDFAVNTITNAAPTVTYMVPESGTYANFNTIDINVNSENTDLAYKYINWRLSQETQTKTAEFLNEAPVNKLVELTDEQAAGKTVGAVAERAKAIDFELVNKNISEWTDKWNKAVNN